jgi:hypothetical protein
MSPRKDRQTERQRRHEERATDFWAAKRSAAKTSEDRARVIFDETRARISDHRVSEVRDRAWAVLEEHARLAQDLVMTVLTHRVGDRE